MFAAEAHILHCLLVVMNVVYWAAKALGRSQIFLVCLRWQGSLAEDLLGQSKEQVEALVRAKAHAEGRHCLRIGRTL